VAVVLGTLGNVTGALVASLMMGVAESLGIQFVGADSGLIVVFVMFLVTLIVRPNGLFGGKRR
jgi:branched-chain amino acid transport system permease protein